MEEKLLRLENTLDSVISSNLSEEAKQVVLNALKKEIFELRQEISIVNKNVETYKGK